MRSEATTRKIRLPWNSMAAQKKKMIKDKLTLVQFFDLGFEEEGYWNYFHMALQIEDTFDILSVEFPDLDFVVLMDQSSGHIKRMGKWELDLEGVNKKMRNTTINELENYPAQLRVGDSQFLSFVFGDKGPFYLSAEERDGLKYDTFTGVKKILKKTKKDVSGRDQRYRLLD